MSLQMYCRRLINTYKKRLSQRSDWLTFAFRTFAFRTFALRTFALRTSGLVNRLAVLTVRKSTRAPTSVKAQQRRQWDT